MKQNLARAKMALPNGYCGLPLQKSCPHANACLTCPLFITTAEFLPQHRKQLDDTRALIARAETDGSHPPRRDEPHRRNQPAHHHHHPRSRPRLPMRGSGQRNMLRKGIIRCAMTTATTSLAAAQRRRADTLERARRALHELGETGQRHTVTQIAAHAGISRSWLYAQPELRDQLRRLTTTARHGQSATHPTARASDASLRQRLTLAHERIRELDNENRQLRNQIAHLHGQLRANRIADTVTDTVHDANTLVTLPNSPSRPR